MTSAEENLMALALRTKPHTNAWLYLSPKKHLKNLFNERELARGMMLQLMQDVNTMSLDKFQADILATRAQ